MHRPCHPEERSDEGSQTASPNGPITILYDHCTAHVILRPAKQAVRILGSFAEWADNDSI